MSWREYFGCPEVFFLGGGGWVGEPGDEKFNISFVLFVVNL